MKFLVLGDIFSGLMPWLIDDHPVKGMPAVYNFFQYFGCSSEHSFEAIIVNPHKQKVIEFENGSTIHLYRVPVKNRKLFRILSYFAMYRHARRHWDAGHFDIIYGMANYSLVASILGHRTDTLTVCRVFGSLAPKLIEEQRYTKVFTRYILEYLTARFGKDILISTNDGTQYEVLVDFAKRTKPFYHLYNGIEREFRDSLAALGPIARFSREAPLNIVSVGRLSYWKRHDLAIDTVEILRKQYKLDVHLRILGDGPDHTKLTRYIALKGLQDRITLCGSLEREAFLHEMSRAHISMFCYDNSTLGNSLWESVFAQRVVAARNSGDTGAVLIHGVNALTASEAGFAPEMAEKIKDLVSGDHQTAIDLTTRARQTVDQLVKPWNQRFQTELDIIDEYRRR